LEEWHLNKKRSAEKRHRQSLRRRSSNKGTKTQIRTAVRKLEEAVEAKDTAAARELLRACTRVLDSAASSGVIHKNTAGRKKSRLTKMLAGVGTP